MYYDKGGPPCGFKLTFSLLAVLLLMSLCMLPLDFRTNLPAQKCYYHGERSGGLILDQKIADSTQVGAFSCDGGDHSNSVVSPTVWGAFADRTLIVVDFATLKSPVVEVRIGRTSDIAKTLAQTNPVTLLPGVNLVGILGNHIRQTFRDTYLSSLGVFVVSYFE